MAMVVEVCQRRGCSLTSWFMRSTRAAQELDLAHERHRISGQYEPPRKPGTGGSRAPTLPPNHTSLLAQIEAQRRAAAGG